MTDDQIRDLVMVSIFIAVLIALFVSLHQRLYHFWKGQRLDRFDHFLDSLQSDRGDYQFFTKGHPQVWCETTEEEIRRHIANQCFAYRGYPLVPSPSNYVMNVNEDRKAVYVVFGDGRNFTFDSNGLAHYEDWIRNANVKD